MSKPKSRFAALKYSSSAGVRVLRKSESFRRLFPDPSSRSPCNGSPARIFAAPIRGPIPCVTVTNLRRWDLGLGVGRGVRGVRMRTHAAGSLHLTEWRVRALTCRLYR
ncbi:hypothetical protein Zmor_010016 [Zophobas morio]|uniref:Uncharacterized protein n=1 Tax=Zophobas morio TaxID=2755281 RepID=A0AA38MII9_9CUCU|nr:hypothetical protein Zmor_010016 [Zophobas morio]